MIREIPVNERTVKERDRLKDLETKVTKYLADAGASPGAKVKEAHRPEVNNMPIKLEEMMQKVQGQLASEDEEDAIF